jgi:gamma-glutamylcyclotransferase (GGCT)/AIG2-like uncharacterized protein YtfP
MITDYLYGAYGSNLSQSQMAIRCPDSVPMGNMVLKGYRLVFRGVADIEKSDGDEVMVGLWKISEKCLDALDQYEGYPRLYTKIYRETDDGLVMLYQMLRANGIHPPSTHYLESISDGFKDFQLDPYYLKDAVADSFIR